MPDRSSPKSTSILRAARALIAPEGAWTQGVYARDTKGESINESCFEAVCFCAEGALFAACSKLNVNFVEPFQLLMDQVGHLPAWNDAPGRTQAEVLALFDAAIAASEAKDEEGDR